MKLNLTPDLYTNGLLSIQPAFLQPKKEAGLEGRGVGAKEISALFLTSQSSDTIFRMKTIILILLLALSALAQSADEVYRQIDQPITVQERKEIFKSQTEAVRFELWRIHFRKFKGLNKAQRSILTRLIAAKTKEEVRAIEPEIRSTFPYALGRRIFYTLGTATPAEKILDEPCGAEGPGTPCVCTTRSYNYSCPDNCVNLSCTVVEASCGVMWLWDCNGMCSCG